jgi:hypothetical protein
MKNLMTFTAFLCFSFQLLGASFTVMNTNDDGPGSLREQVSLAIPSTGVDTIQFDNSINGDTIFLTTGGIFVGNPLVIIGNGPGNTIISGDSSRIFFLGIGAFQTEIRNMQIINGLEESASGGGVNISGPSPSFYNVHFKNNRVTGATRVGGAVNISAFDGDTISITFEDCLFEDNSAFLRGGGVYISGNDVGVKVIFRRCRFEENECLDGNGGAVYFFSTNNLNTHGSFYDCAFVDNYAESSGGGIFANGFNGEPSCYVKGCRFAGNEAENSAGGAISFSIAGSGTSNSQIINSIFTGNQAGFRGGAVNFSDLAGSADFSIINVTFSGNNADLEGGALYLNGINGNLFLPKIYNTAISGNSSGIQGSFFNPDTRHCLIQDSLYSGPGNLDGSQMVFIPEFVEEPNFTSAPDTSGDLRLKTCSPLINAGDAIAYN